MCDRNWLKPEITGDSLNIEGFTFVRSDRTAESGKSRGGGLGVYVNQRWCTNITLKETYCDCDLELMVVSLRPFYMPREFSAIHVVVVYMPPDANYNAAVGKLHEHIDMIENHSPDSVNIIVGDFNQCPVRNNLPGYDQFVTCKTRGDNIIDLCFVNVKNSYVSHQKPALGESDHNMIHMVPTYKQKLKSSKPITRSRQVWSDEVCDSLRACFELTDWDVLYSQDASIDDNVMVITDYINFCTDLLVPVKNVVCYPNNKPWVTSDLKVLLNKKKQALAIHDKDGLRLVKSELRSMIKKCKLDYKNTLEQLFRSNDTRKAWAGLRMVSGYKPKSMMLETNDELAFANELNEFYARFECDPEPGIDNLLKQLKSEQCQCMSVSEKEVQQCFVKQHIGKAAGPDRITGKVIKQCSHQLAPIFTVLFNDSFKLHQVPNMWKTATQVPLPKKDIPRTKNDLRPVALTALVMKACERLFFNLNRASIMDNTDKMQFAYQENRGVDDAIITLVHTIQEHIDHPKSYVRALFVDFSSAFNTISPSIMVRKLVKMNFNPNAILWIYDFLTNRKQCVRYKSTMSSYITTNTGAPQGCVLSPLLFTLYTSDCKPTATSCQIIKYADDTVLLGNFTGTMSSKDYMDEIARFGEWCHTNNLLLNVLKTKEMIIDPRTKKDSYEPILINGTAVETVTQYKYLGTIINNKLNWSDNIQSLKVKAHKRLYFLRKLREFGVNTTMMRLFYDSIIKSVVKFCMLLWFSSLTQKQMIILTRIDKCAKRLINDNVCTDWEAEFNALVYCKVKMLLNCPSHPLHQFFNYLPSGRRLRTFRCRTARFRTSFIPNAIVVYNRL